MYNCVSVANKYAYMSKALSYHSLNKAHCIHPVPWFTDNWYKGTGIPYIPNLTKFIWLTISTGMWGGGGERECEEEGQRQRSKYGGADKRQQIQWQKDRYVNIYIYMNTYIHIKQKPGQTQHQLEPYLLQVQLHLKLSICETFPSSGFT